jgi:hypothetical protein
MFNKESVYQEFANLRVVNIATMMYILRRSAEYKCYSLPNSVLIALDNLEEAFEAEVSELHTPTKPSFEYMQENS